MTNEDVKLSINNPDPNATINFLIQEQQKDFAGATVTLHGQNHEEIVLNIRSVSCKQLAQIMNVLEKLKDVIGSQQFEIPTPTPPPYDIEKYPWYPHPYLPTNPFTPNTTWCNNSRDNKYGDHDED